MKHERRNPKECFTKAMNTATSIRMSGL